MSPKKQSTGVSVLTIGNALTASRMLLLPVLVCAIVLNQGYLAVAAMALVIISDLLDGRVSRRLGQTSYFGATFDSTIDFALIYSLFITFYAAGRLATYQFAIIYLAMLTTFMMQIGNMASRQSEGIVKSRTGKLTGAVQYGFLLFLVVSEVLPKTALLLDIKTVFFAVLAVLIVLSSIGAVLRVRKIL